MHFHFREEGWSISAETEGSLAWIHGFILLSYPEASPVLLDPAGKPASGRVSHAAYQSESASLEML